MKKLGFALIAAVASFTVTLLVGEAGLRIAGVSFAVAPKSFEFGAPRPRTFHLLRSDGDVFWVPRGYRRVLARAAAGRLDIAFLGDSCTELATWPDLLEMKIREAGVPIRGANFAVSAWTSYQGLRQLERDVLPRRPAVVTLNFGWNDHWIGFGVSDREVAAALDTLEPVRDVRIVQLLFKSWLLYRARDRSAWPLRVPLPEFKENLRSMLRLARASGVVPVLLTAPTAIEPESVPPDRGQRWLNDMDDLVPLHRSYAAAVREIAAAEQAPLCDLAERFDAISAAQRVRSFIADGIHFSSVGDAHVAAYLFHCFFREAEVVEALRLERVSSRR